MNNYNPQQSRGPLLSRLLSVGILLFPSLSLAVCAGYYQSSLLAIGAVANGLGATLFLRGQLAWRPPISTSTMMLYLIALGWLWFDTRGNADEVARFIRGSYLLITIAILISHDLYRTGVDHRRRAQKICQKLLSRTQWPQNLADFAQIPEIQILQNLVRNDISLLRDLLEDRRTEVVLAGLMAVQNRAAWRWDEADLILRLAQTQASVEVRQLAVLALRHANIIVVIEYLGEFLRDPTYAVREVTGQVLLGGGPKRWGFVRESVRRVLADPHFSQDGALPGSTGYLSQLAICDLMNWSNEPQPLGERAIQTLRLHYAYLLEQQYDPALCAELARQIIDLNLAPTLRVEIAMLLRGTGLLPPELLDRMTDMDQPSPIRLLGVETLLAQDPSDASALAVLRGLSRQPNRESALAIARILQNYLGIPFQLPPLGVALNSRQAAEIAQAVLRWSNQSSSERGRGHAMPMSFGNQGNHGSSIVVLGEPTVYTQTGPTSAPGLSDRKLQ